MIDPLKVVLVRRPDESFAVDDPILWGYPERPDLSRAQQEHDEFVGILSGADVEVLYHEEPLDDCADAIFVRDPAMIISDGAIIFQMAKKLRRGEQDGIRRCLEKLGIPILHQFSGDVFIDGGDLVWIDRHTLAIGQGSRTGQAGFDQLRNVLSGHGINVLPVPFENALHLSSVLCIVHHNIAVVLPRYLPGSFTRYLEGLGFRLITLPDEEDDSLGISILTLSPGRCLMLQGNPVTAQRLRSAGCEVMTYQGDEISVKGGGGPLCLTQPVLREPE
ncbi:MAG: arginine deiminase family protein [candidate division Zixibacteria bacterium]|nr:arginine deiminase family protein [candidate division Zixibacteria bacterium]